VTRGCPRSPPEQDLIGRTLAKVHQASVGFEVDGAKRFHWVDPEADYLAGALAAAGHQGGA